MIVELAQENQIDLVVVGPEVPLCNGAVDALQEAEILVYGPDQAGARLEGSKAYTKDFLAKYEIPTADYGNFTQIEPHSGISQNVIFPWWSRQVVWRPEKGC